MSINSKSLSNVHNKKTHLSAVGVIIAVLMVINKSEARGGTINGTGLVPTATIMMNNAVAHQASIPHLAMLSNNNWDNHNHNHSISNLGAQKDSTGAKNAQGTDHLAKNFGVPPEDAQKYLAKIESEEGNEYPDSPFAKFAEMENSEWNKVNGEHKEGIKRVKAKAGAIDYPKQGTAARRIKVTWPSLVRLRWGKQKKAQRKRKRTSSYFELRK